MSAPNGQRVERGCPSCGCPYIHWDGTFWWCAATRIRHCIDCGTLLPKYAGLVQINVARGQLEDNRALAKERKGDLAAHEYKPVIVVAEGPDGPRKSSHELIILSRPRVMVRYTPLVESWGQAHVFLETMAELEPVTWRAPSPTP